MGNGWKKAGLIGLGAVLGLLLSLNFSALADREPRLAIPYEDLQLFSAVFGRIKSDYVEPVPDDKLIKEAINGMVHGLDPHSDFLDADAFKELQISTQGKFGGLGIEVGVEDGIIKVVSPIEDTPAFRAGIKAGDLIVKIDDTVTRGLPLSKAVEKMRGKPGTQIVLTVARKDVDLPMSFTLTREIINFRSVRAKLIEPGYGYLRIVQFQERTGEDMAKALRDLYKQGELTGLVLDLRSDPGGLLNVSVGVASAFLPQDALVVYTDGVGRRRHSVGFRNRRWRAAGSQARGGDGCADFRQGLGSDHPAARAQHRAQADYRALLHSERTLDPGQGHRARRRGGRWARVAIAHARGESRSPSG
jgi:carboxyl-terminal processing protease